MTTSGRERVLVVCTANICRSPMIEAVLREEAEAHELPWEIASAGVRARPGQPVDAHAAAALGRRGHAIESHEAHRVTAEDVAAADVVLVATAAHRTAVVGLYPPAVRRTFVLLDFARLLAAAGEAGPRVPHLVAAASRARSRVGRASDVELADPFGRPDEFFERCLDEIERAVAEIVGAATR